MACAAGMLTMDFPNAAVWQNCWSDLPPNAMHVVISRLSIWYNSVIWHKAYRRRRLYPSFRHRRYHIMTALPNTAVTVQGLNLSWVIM